VLLQEMDCSLLPADLGYTDRDQTLAAAAPLSTPRRSFGRPMVSGLLVGEAKPCFILLEAGSEHFHLPASVLTHDPDEDASVTRSTATRGLLRRGDHGTGLQSRTLSPQECRSQTDGWGRETHITDVLVGSAMTLRSKITSKQERARKHQEKGAAGFAADDSLNPNFLTSEEVCEKEIKSVMLRNVPQSCGQDDVVAKLHEDGFQGQFDFVYAPFDLRRSSTKGYVFINMCSVQAAASLVELWTGRSFWPQVSLGYNAPLQFSAADLQGLEANTRKMLRSKLQRIRNPRLRPYISPTLATALQQPIGS